MYSGTIGDLNRNSLQIETEQRLSQSQQEWWRLFQAWKWLHNTSLKSEFCEDSFGTHADVVSPLEPKLEAITVGANG